MAAVVTMDVLEGMAASHKLTEGWAITRGALVTNLGSYSDTGAMLAAAEAAIIAVTGDRGSACPDISVPTYLDEFIPEFISDQVVRFRIVYRGFKKCVYEFDGSLSQVNTNLDINGNPVVLQYTYPSDYKLVPQRAGSLVPQGGWMARQIPEATVTINFTIANGFVIGGVSRTGIEAASWFASFQGTMNNATYNLGLISGAYHTWLVTRVRAVSPDAGNTFNMSMTFQYRPLTWDQHVTFINPDDGKPPPDLIAPGGSFPGAQTAPGYTTVQILSDTTFPVVSFTDN